MQDTDAMGGNAEDWPAGSMPDNVGDVQAVIESAKSRGIEPLEQFIRRRFPDASDDKVRETAEVALEVIDTVPIFFARAAQEARAQQLGSLVNPLLEHAARYFVRPVDLIPEMTQGLAGLLDDAYLVLRILASLEEGPKPLVEWDLDEPLALLRGLIGERIARELDAIAESAMEEVLDDLNRLWEGMAH